MKKLIKIYIKHRVDSSRVLTQIEFFKSNQFIFKKIVFQIVLKINQV